MSTLRTRELAYREAEGVEVALLWPVGGQSVVVRVVDWKEGHSFELSVRGERALDAFYHPYSYAAAPGQS